MVDKTIAIIPARAGSKRIIGKNTIDFMGKPLIAWTIEAAIKSNCFDRIIVSTDDIKIADIAKEYGLEIPFLRDKFQDDFSTLAEVAIYTTEKCEAFYGETYSNTTILQATCPLRDENIIKDAFKYYNENNLKMLVTASSFVGNPWWAAKLDKNNKPDFILKNPAQARSQDCPSLYYPNGSVTIADKKLLSETKSIYTEDLRFFEIDWKKSIDIDTYEDVEFAKAIYLMNMGKQNSEL